MALSSPHRPAPPLHPPRRLDSPAHLALVERATLQQPYQYTMSSPFYSQTIDRFLQAEIAAALRRNEEALRWFGSFNGISTLSADS